MPNKSFSCKGKICFAERHQGVHQVRDDPLLSQCHDEMRQKYHLQKHSGSSSFLKVWGHLADPAHQEKFPNSAGFWIVELVAEGGGEAEIVEVGHSQIVRIF